MKKIFTLLLSCTLLFACKQSNTNTDTASSDKPAEEKEKAYTITPFTNSTAFPDAQLSLASYKDGKFDFTVESDSYSLGAQTPDADSKMCANSGKGQHIHLIVGTDPYAAKYEADFDYEVADGDHNVLAFISRSYHESIKTDKSYIAQKMGIKDNTLTSAEDITGEMLFYSRPKGTYVGKANTDKIMLDFFLVNTDLGADRKIVASINGEEHTIEKWQPYYIEGMPMGKNTITLTLTDNAGKKIDVPGNPVTREFELKADPAEEM